MALSEQIDALEQRLTQLLGVMENMAAANEELREECRQLREKNEQAGMKIEAILKSLRQQTPQTEN